MLIPTHADHRWVVNVPLRPGLPEAPVDLVRTTLGLPDLTVEVLTDSTWTAAAQTARQFSEGPVFLVGDAAHRVPPAGATGVSSAHGRRAQSRLEDRRGLRRLGASGPAGHVRSGAPRGRPDHDPGRARSVALHDVAGRYGPERGHENRGHGLSVRLGRRGRRVPGRTVRRSVRPLGRARGSGPARLAGRGPGRLDHRPLRTRLRPARRIRRVGVVGCRGRGRGGDGCAGGRPRSSPIRRRPRRTPSPGRTAVLVRPDGHVAGRLEPGELLGRRRHGPN